MDDSKNPTWRLYQLLNQTRQAKSGEAIKSVWARVFNVPEGDLVTIFRNLVLLQDSITETEARVRSSPIRNKELYLRSLDSVRKALAYGNFDTTWNQVSSLLNPQVLTDLEHCADRLADHYPESEISQTDLNQIWSEVDGLFDQIKQAELEPELQVMILDLLETIRRLLAEYHIRGAEALREALEISLGKLVAIYKKPDAKSQIHRIWRVLITIDDVVTRAKKYLPVVNTFKGLLGSSDPTETQQP